mmetsp:Transcript_18480/g.57350  ORF Transcript_18480/g.57350 Transcript_18480/m.57350 type:complete len:289 (-) Transcript_18480:363-1229(-)
MPSGAVRAACAMRAPIPALNSGSSGGGGRLWPCSERTRSRATPTCAPSAATSAGARSSRSSRCRDEGASRAAMAMAAHDATRPASTSPIAACHAVRCALYSHATAGATAHFLVSASPPPRPMPAPPREVFAGGGVLARDGGVRRTLPPAPPAAAAGASDRAPPGPSARSTASSVSCRCVVRYCVQAAVRSSAACPAAPPCAGRTLLRYMARTYHVARATGTAAAARWSSSARPRGAEGTSAASLSSGWAGSASARKNSRSAASPSPPLPRSSGSASAGCSCARASGRP